MKKIYKICTSFILWGIMSTPICYAQELPTYLPSEGIVAWYPFNGNANDESGNNNNGIVEGASLTTDRYGTENSAYLFDGTSFISGLSDNYPITTRTISLWYNAKTLGETGVGKQLFGYGGGSCGNSWLMYMDYPTTGPGDLGIEGHCLAFKTIGTYPQPANNAWHHVAVTYDGTNLVIYFDGILASSNPRSVTTTSVAGKKFFIGAEPFTNGIQPYVDNVWPFFNGSIDDVAIYNKALTEEEVSQLYTAVKQNQTISFTLLSDVSINTNEVLLEASSTSGLPITFTTDDNSKILINGNTVTPLEPGSITITATQAGNHYFEPAESISQTICVLPSKPTITVTGLGTENVVLQSSSTTNNQWFQNNISIDGANLEFYTVTEPGLYSVQVNYDECKSDLSEQIPVIITELEDGRELQFDLNVFPIPSKDLLWIQVNGLLPKEDCTIKIYDMMGREVTHWRYDGEEKQLSIKTWGNGTYILNASNNHFTLFKRIIKN